MRIQQLMKFHKLYKPAGDEGSDTGGTGTGGDAAATVAAQAAAEAAALAAAEAAALAAAEAAKSGGTKPSDAEAKLLKDVMKQKARADEAAAELAKAKELLKGFEGIDAAKVRALAAEAEEVERKRLVAAGDFDRLTKQMGERHTAEKSTLEASIAESNLVTTSLQKQIADLTVGTSFTTSKFVTEDLTLTPNKARVIYGAHFEFKDGKVIGFDKPAGASDRTMLVNSTGDALSFDEAIAKIVDADPDKNELIRSKMKSGAGSTTVKGAKKVGIEQNSQLDGVSKIAAGLKALAKKT